MAHKSPPPETRLFNVADYLVATSIVCTVTIACTIGIWTYFCTFDRRAELGLVSDNTYMKVLKIQGIALGVCIGCIVIAQLMFALDTHRVANSSKLVPTTN